MIKVWLSGANSQIGKAINDIFCPTDLELFNTDKDEVDVTDLKAVMNFAQVSRPDIIINCSAITDINLCEKDHKLAFGVNAIGARNLATAAERLGAKLVQMSTDDVFDGDSEVPYNEFDNPVPRSIYGKSKLAGEQMVSSLCTRHIIIRSSWVYGTGADFVHEFLEADGRIEVASDECAVPTSAKELAKVIMNLIDGTNYGIFHIVCTGGPVSRYEYAVKLKELTGKDIEVKETAGQKHVRPVYSLLDNMMLRICGLEEPADWKESLQEFLKEMR